MRARAFICAVALLAAVPSCSSPSCAETRGLNERVADAQYHLRALDHLLDAKSPDTKVGEEERFLVQALLDAADGIHDAAPAEASGYQAAAQPFRGVVTETNIEPLRSAVRDLPTILGELNRQLDEAQRQHGCYDM